MQAHRIRSSCGWPVAVALAQFASQRCESDCGVGIPAGKRVRVPEAPKSFGKSASSVGAQYVLGDGERSRGRKPPGTPADLGLLITTMPDAGGVPHLRELLRG